MLLKYCKYIFICNSFYKVVDDIFLMKIIERDKSVVVACDVSTLVNFRDIVSSTADNEKIGGYKIGFSLGLKYGLPKIVEAAREYGDKPLIYDHQKAGTDIPDIGKNFAEVCSNAGIDAVILFPQAGPVTERAWIKAAKDWELGVIVGGRMTHDAYSESEGGFITDKGALEMYRIADEEGVRDFVVPGNKPEVIMEIKRVLENVEKPVFYAPGFITQGGNISDAAKVVGDRFHAIVGSAIYKNEDRKVAALEMTSQI